MGYLLLDAWIGNTDRHHENWGWVWEFGSASWHLAPTFDHASSLGRNESDAARQRRLTTRDPKFSVKAFVEKARSAFYAIEGDTKPLATFKAFSLAAERHREAALAWLSRLEKISLADTLELFERIPQERITNITIEFGQKMLEVSKEKLLQIAEGSP